MNSRTIELLLNSLSQDPSNWDIRLHVAELLTAEGDHSRAADILKAPQSLPETEDKLLVIAELLANHDWQEALQILDSIISSNKACSKAYRQKADIYRERGMKDEARKQYNVAAVIDESMEDPEFEAWLDTDSTPPQSPTSPKLETPPPIPMANTNSHLPYYTSSDESNLEEDEFIETDSSLDALLNSTRQLIDFSDIGGMEQLKERIRMSIIYPFKNKDLFKKFKKRSGGGLLFYGPPGCGKTLISRATAGECGAHFINISVHDILSKWLGESEQRMHSLFEVARRKAPTIIFIDEVDALGVKRSDAGYTASLVNTLLTEMDGSQSDNEELLIIGATNTPWRVDSAFRRPGRFDHVLFVPPPDLEAREAILKILLSDIPQDKIDIRKLAKITDKFSGADLSAVVDRATESVIQEIMKSGKEIKLNQKHLLQAAKTTRPTTLEWIEQASNYASYANQSGLYDDLAEYIRSI
ncbi:ATPase family associated with various cellular activities (AAA) [Rubritalea squalenifaciens DSM 18772]|uniref:ATPase family associated with various cellular activities (AAA) n=1 Tax=Rubritalea squalenifaciens DSM 18772 TaxID=1123071 RepID=A0A1M6P2Q6_9BACT|nr:ATP-binding protein [Rubritalea squalenifaciens]SHK02287.1 ATPase family associated with various cellular activities (AAA) [Rubritalea squalenifaciens DSM 18772]